jgi:selenocysteine-specific elongation factor
VAQEAFAELQKAGAVIALEGSQESALLTGDGWERILDSFNDLLAGFHAQFPLRRGMARGEARSRLQVAMGAPSLPVRLFNAIVERAQEAERVQSDDNVVWLAGFVVALSPQQQAMVEHLLKEFSAAGYAPPNLPETLAMLNQGETLLEMLVEQGRMVQMSGGVLFRREEFDAMVAALQTYLREHGSITLAQTRDLFDTSRKYAQAVLEEMDARRITRREGDTRVLRETRAS